MDRTHTAHYNKLSVITKGTNLHAGTDAFPIIIAMVQRVIIRGGFFYALVANGAGAFAVFGMRRYG
ncbi:hypothetical protein HMPREF3224_02109, partial [Anaerococcus hydrogenalis]